MEKNQIILSDIEKQDEFLDEYRFALSKGFNIQTNQIVITYPRSNDESLITATISFRTEDFNNITVNQFNKFSSNKSKI